jgi:hypothetical protein
LACIKNCWRNTQGFSLSKQAPLSTRPSEVTSKQSHNMCRPQRTSSTGRQAAEPFSTAMQHQSGRRQGALLRAARRIDGGLLRRAHRVLVLVPVSPVTRRARLCPWRRACRATRKTLRRGAISGPSSARTLPPCLSLSEACQKRSRAHDGLRFACTHCPAIGYASVRPARLAATSEEAITRGSG